jgi:hypothetical protein
MNPGRSRRIFVLVQHAAEIVTPVDGQIGEPVQIADRFWQWREWTCVRDPLMWPMLGPPRRGAGPSRYRRRIRRTEVADTATPSWRHSPTILTYPQPGLFPGLWVQIPRQGRDLGIGRGLPDDGVLKMNAFN